MAQIAHCSGKSIFKSCRCQIGGSSGTGSRFIYYRQDALDLTDAEIALLKEYVEQGGFILGVAGCQSARFEESFRELTPRLFPPGEGVLKKLSFDHRSFAASFCLIRKALELWALMLAAAHQ